MKILPEMYLQTWKNWSNFGSRPPPEPDPGIFKRILNIAGGHFSTILLTSLEELIRSSRKILSEMFLFESGPYQQCDPESGSMWPWKFNFTSLSQETRKSPLNFQDHMDPDSGSHCWYGPDSPSLCSALFGCSCLLLLLLLNYTNHSDFLQMCWRDTSHS